MPDLNKADNYIQIAVCRDDEKRNRETGSFFGDFRTSLSAGISRLFGMFLFALY